MESLIVKRVLAIVEGESADFKLINHFFNLFFDDEFYVWAYKTNFYALYDTLSLEDENNYDDLDIKQVIKSREASTEIKAKLDEKYTDIILVFDLDPQDQRFKEEKVYKMLSVFHESSDNGKLYINYPMVEAFKHISSTTDLTYIDRVVNMDDLRNKTYKTIVSKVSFETDFEKYNIDMCLDVFKLNLIKFNNLLYQKKELPTNIEEYNQLDVMQLLQLQCNSIREYDMLHVICTCIMCIIDHKPMFYLSKMWQIKE